MFDLITGKTRHIPSKPGVPLLLSMSAQLTLVAAVVVPVLFFTGALPEVPTMMAFVAEAPAPPPPPPPPPPPAAHAATPPQAHPVPAPGAAPVEPPSTIQPERANDRRRDRRSRWSRRRGSRRRRRRRRRRTAERHSATATTPPPAPPRAPVRVGGQIQAPALTRRVEPVYPDLAVSARIRGVVILEAMVDKDGRVVEVKVLRTANKLLDDAAITAVRQWQYRPLILNGLPEPFVLTVVLTFAFTEDS